MRVVVDNHLSEAGERRVGLVVRHLVSSVEQPEDGFTIVDTGQEDHQLDVDGDEVEVELGEVEVDGDVEAHLTGVYGGEKLTHMILEVEQIDECVVVQGEGLDYFASERVHIVQGFEVCVG